MVVIDAYQDEKDLIKIMKLIEKDLSEPYTIYTYRYFTHNWKGFTFTAHKDKSQQNENDTKEGSVARLGNPNPNERNPNPNERNPNPNPNPNERNPNPTPITEDDSMIGVIICRLELHKGRLDSRMRGTRSNFYLLIHPQSRIHWNVGSLKNSSWSRNRQKASCSRHQ